MKLPHFILIHLAAKRSWLSYLVKPAKIAGLVVACVVLVAGGVLAAPALGLLAIGALLVFLCL